MIRTLRTAALASALLLIVLEFLGMRDFARSPYTGIQHNNLIVRAIDLDGPNRDLGLRLGDRIVRVNGTAVRNVNHYAYLLASAPPPSFLDLTVARGDSLFDVSVRSMAQPSVRVMGKLSIVIVAFTFVLIGFVVLLKRPDILGLLFTANCYILSFLVSERPVTGSPLLQIIGELGYDFLFISLPAFFLHFFLLFPGREIERGTRRALLARFLYAPVAILSLLTLVAALRQYDAPGDASLGGFINAINALAVCVWLGYITASLALFVRTYFLSERVQRIKFRVVLLGVAAGIVPLTVLMLLKQFQPSMAVPAPYLWPLFLSFMPISFAYAILKHRAYDLGLLYRTIFVYALLLAFVLGVYFVSVNVLGEEMDRRFGVPRSAVTVFVIVLLAVAVMPARAVFQRLADRLTAGRRAAATNEIVAFSRRIQFLLSLEEVSSFVAERMADIAQAEHAYLFLRGETGDYALRASAPAGMRTPLTSFPPGTALIKLMQQERVPVMLEYFDRLWLKSNLDRISRELVSLSQAYAAVPLIEQDELLGFVLMGRKSSGRPYTGADAELLELLAERSAVSIMNIRLCGDSIIKDRLEKELRLASEIQTRLLPSRFPSLRGAEIAAKLVTSHEVGGDFYDFVEPEPGVVGIAVADVSGKGIPAALLMTTLQASFRAEAVKNPAPAVIVSALNASLYERSDDEKFATFFYALYDDATGIVRFSNAGSSPPFIISGEGRISRLHRGGVLIGVEARSDYSEGVVKLRQNDLMLIFTDGCTDQESADGEPFEEKRLVDFIRNNLTLSVDAMIEKLFATLIAFGERNLKDDMTVVLLRRILP